MSTAAVVPLHRGEEVRPQDAFRADLRTRLDQLKEGSKDAQTSRELLKMFEEYDQAADKAKPEKDSLVAQVKKRLDGLRAKPGPLSSAQERDVLIIVFFGEGKLSFEVRLSACAIIEVKGTDESIKQICRSYPRFRTVFD